MSEDEAPSITLLTTRPLGKGWPAVRRWKVTGEDEIDGVELASTLPDRADHYVIAHRAITGNRPWQATWFDDRGAGGDLRRATLEEALNEQAPPGQYMIRALHLKADRTRGNPMSEPTKAIRMFRRFHTHAWRGEGDFHRSLAIPDRVVCLGEAVHVLYESDKANPESGEEEGWINYIHHHSRGVHVYRPAARGDADLVAVPAWLRASDQLTWLGRCDGFAYRNENGRQCDAKGTQPLPELYTTPNGKALLVIQSKRTLLALVWGGRLGVERRGIVH